MKHLLLILLIHSCGNKSVVDCDTPTSGVPCSARSKDDDARIALNKGDLTTAVAILKELVAGDPTGYQRYPLLSAALAGKSGFDIFNVVKGNFGGNSSLVQTLGAFLPTPASKGAAYATSLTDMNDAVQTLLAVPAALRSDIAADKFAASCALQLTLYQAAYSLMLINQFTYSSAGYDPSQLSKMTAADAALILKNLLAAGSVASGASGEAANAAVTKAYASIQAQPGSTDEEKIAAYVKASH